MLLVVRIRHRSNNGECSNYHSLSIYSFADIILIVPPVQATITRCLKFKLSLCELEIQLFFWGVEVITMSKKCQWNKVNFGIKTPSRLYAYILTNVYYGLASRRRLVCVPIYAVFGAKSRTGYIGLDSADPLLVLSFSFGVSLGADGGTRLSICISILLSTSGDQNLRSLLTFRNFWLTKQTENNDETY